MRWICRILNSAGMNTICVYDVSRIKEELGFVAERLPERGGSDD